MDFFQLYTGLANNIIMHTVWFTVGEKISNMNSERLLCLRLFLDRYRIKEPQGIFPQKNKPRAVDFITVLFTLVIF